MDQFGELRKRVESAVLVFANHYQFAPAQDFPVRMVGSRMMLWGISGAGRVRSAGLTMDLEPGAVIILPWRHDIRYFADARDPFLTGAAHLLPWHAAGVPIQPWAGHGPDDPLNASPYRRDVDWPGFSRPRTFTGPPAARLIRLGEAAVDYFSDDDPDDAGMRAFGLLLGRAIAALRPGPGAEDAIPSSLSAMQEYARTRLPFALTTETLAAVGACSVSTAERQFRRYTGRSPRNWIRDERLALAARLLRTTNRRINDVAAAAGFDDPLYFSRAFRARYGIPPSRYSRRTPLL